MSKRKKSKAKASTKAARSKQSGKKSLTVPIIGVFLIVSAVAGYFFFSKKQPTATELKTAASNCPTQGVRRLEHRTPLPANLFVGRVRAAYASAQAIPEVIDQLYCYCHCRENIGHKSLLSCYTDNHAAGCDICIVEAEMAAQLTAQGYCPSDIQKAIDKRFGQI